MSFLKMLGIKISLFIFLFVGQTYATSRPPFSMMMYYVGQMILDPGININQITDHSDYIKLKGQARNKRQAYLLAEKLLHSNMQKEFNFEDIIPFWNKNEFTFILKKPKTKIQQIPIEIKSPLIRNSLDSKFSLQGSCTKEGAEIILSGDFQGKTTCKKGSWTIELSAKNIELPIVGVKVSQGLLSNPIEDCRSFLIRRP